MEFKSCKVKIERTGLYFEAGNRSVANVSWFVAHGYGQLASNIIRKFDRFVEVGHFVTAVEGANRFYWKGVSGEVAATWMTKRSRMDEIEDNNSYLSQLFDQHKIPGKNILLGFSQGGTTLWRWIFEKKPDFDVFINYAGWMPEDIPLNELIEFLGDKTLIFVAGNEDQYLTEDRVRAFKEVLERSGLNVIIHRKEGGHRIDRDVLDEIYRTYIE